MSQSLSADFTTNAVPVLVRTISNTTNSSLINQSNKILLAHPVTSNVSSTRSSFSVFGTSKPLVASTKRILPICISKPSSVLPNGRLIGESSSSTAKPVFVVTPNAMNMKTLKPQSIPVPVRNVQFAISQNNQQNINNDSPTSESAPTNILVANIKGLTTFTSVMDATANSIKKPSTAPVNNNWDPFASGDQITVSCRKKHAILDRTKLGSGQKGKCILFESDWITPSQFEIECGLSTSRDWKRSIRHGAYTLLKLINEGHLKPHSAACACAVCSDDSSITCPVRLFQPYKRRKRNSSVPAGSQSDEGSCKTALLTGNSKNLHSQAIAAPELCTPTNLIQSVPCSSKPAVASDAESIVRLLIAESQLAEQRTWWQLEEMSNNLLEQAQRLKLAIAEAKSQSYNQRINLIQKLAAQYNKEQVSEFPVTRASVSYSQVLNASVVAPSSVLIETSPAKDVKQQEASVKSDAMNSLQYCNTCGNHAVSECTGCHKATYCSTACQEKDWIRGHSEICLLNSNTEQSIKDKAEKALVIRSSPSDVDSYDVMSTASVLLKERTTTTAEST